MAVVIAVVVVVVIPAAERLDRNWAGVPVDGREREMKEQVKGKVQYTQHKTHLIIRRRRTAFGRGHFSFEIANLILGGPQ